MKEDCVLLVLLILYLFQTVEASVGDREPYFRTCLNLCLQAKCSAKSLPQFLSEQPTSHRLLQWTCEDECKYQCMWRTVAQFKARNVSCPQFYGKWPFVAVLGVQEPASVVFSIFNALSQLIAFRYVLSNLTGKEPMSTVWGCNYVVSINAWIWSIVFHTRDTPFTELMDYACALSLVLFSFYALIIRVVIACTPAGPRRVQCVTAVSAAVLAFYCRHIHYLAYIKFDYGYNMAVNVTVGVVSIVGWLAWCGHQWARHGRTYPLRTCAVTMTLTGAATSLELLDFPPLAAWTLDAHALWHLSTAPLPLLFSRFIVDDCKVLMEQSAPRLG